MELSIFLTILLTAMSTNAYNILIMSPHALGPSHKKGMLPVAKGLAESGHQVVFWSPSLTTEDLVTNLPANVEDRLSLTSANQSAFFTSLASAKPEESFGAIIWQMEGTNTIGLLMPWRSNCEVCKLFLGSNFTEFLSILSYKSWDLAIVDTLFAPCAYLAVKELEIPYIAWSSSLIFLHTARAVGMPLRPSVYPQTFDLGIVDTTNFWHRLNSAKTLVAFSSAFKLVEWMTRRSLLGHFDQFNFNSFDRGANLATGQFSNLLDWPTPLLPNTEIFGSHCSETDGNLLPPDLLSFVEDPTSLGTIYIAFGHDIRWSLAPSSSLKAFESALNRLTQYRVIWQSDLISNSSSQHILRREWLPQVDILHHPKTKVFVSHTGAKSLLESICAGVPLVGMPQYAEQYRNTAIVDYRKIGRFLDKLRLTDDLVYDTIVDVATNHLYSDNIRKSKDFFQDTIIPPTDFAVFHVERSVRRAKELKLFRNKGAKLSYFVYFSLDIIISVLVITTAIVGSFAVFVKRILTAGKSKLD